MIQVLSWHRSIGHDHTYLMWKSVGLHRYDVYHVPVLASKKTLSSAEIIVHTLPGSIHVQQQSLAANNMLASWDASKHLDSVDCFSQRSLIHWVYQMDLLVEQPGFVPAVKWGFW